MKYITLTLCLVLGLVVSCLGRRCLTKPNDECLTCARGGLSDATFDDLISKCSEENCFNVCFMKGLRVAFKTALRECDSCKRE
ncbi:Uncharacterised protein g7108 [Pycnogonum litorale]